MYKLIIPKDAYLYYGRILKIIERYKERESDQIASSGVPLFVDMIARLRTIFEKAVSEMKTEGIDNKLTLGKKLVPIFSKYRLSQNITAEVYKTLNHCNDAVHYEKNKIMKSISDFKESVYGLSIFIFEYSNEPIPQDLVLFYQIPKILNTGTKSNLSTINQPISSALREREVDLASKASTMLPILLVLDISTSMAEENRINELSKAVTWFYKAMSIDEITRDSVEIGIVTFGHEAVQKVKFSSIEKQSKVFDSFSLDANGEFTNIGLGMTLALQAIISLKSEYSEIGLDYHQPWIVLITDCDGRGIDDYEIAAQKTADMINQERLVLFPISVGSGNLRILQDFLPKNGGKPWKLKERSFGQFFDWLKDNALFISKSRPDEKLPLSTPSEWSLLK